jgi:hypothetical protein
MEGTQQGGEVMGGYMNPEDADIHYRFTYDENADPSEAKCTRCKEPEKIEFIDVDDGWCRECVREVEREVALREEVGHDYD